MAYLTLQEFKQWKNITSTDTTDDQLITSLIDYSQAAIEENTHRTFEADAATTRTFDAIADTNGTTLYLDRDLCAITSITNGDGTTVSAASYVTNPRNDTPYHSIKLKSSAGIVWTYGNDPENAISVTGKWAYSAEPSQEVKAVMCELVGWLYNRRHSGNEDGRIVSPAGIVIDSSEYPSMVTAFFRRMVRAF